MGLTPTTLLASLLSAHQPLLSFLISLGAPVVYPMRGVRLHRPISIAAIQRAHGQAAALGGKVISIVQHAGVGIVLATAVSIISTSIQLGAKRVLVWACTNKAMPLVWTFMSVACDGRLRLQDCFEMQQSTVEPRPPL